MAGPRGASGIEHLSRLNDGGPVLSRPVGDRDHRFAERASQLRKLVVDTWWNRRKDGARDKAVALEPAQRQRQHTLGDPPDRAAQLVEPHGAVGEELHDQHGPLVADTRERLADRVAFLGLRFVTWCQKSASLWDRLVVIILAPVTKGNQLDLKKKNISMNVISVIIGSTREGRFSEKPARSIFQHLKKREGVDARLLDLRDFQCRSSISR